MSDKYIWVCNFCGKIMHNELEVRTHSKQECSKYLADHSPGFSKEEFERARFETEPDDR